MSARRESVLAALKAAGRAGVSGEALAHEIGVSRAAIAKHMAALRKLGYSIEAHPGSGYVLLSVPDLPLAEEVAPLLTSDLWVDVIGLDHTGSTNDDAKRLARAGAPEGTVVLATRQDAGRGRLGREWSSPEGGVYLSALLRPRCPLVDLAPLALVVSLGVARGLDVVGVGSLLKWPNDVLSPQGKLAGVLLEMSAESDRAEWVVAGVGLNVHRSVDPPPGAAYVDEISTATGVDIRVASVAAHALDGIAATYREFCSGGFDALVAEYEERSMLTGRDVCVCHADGRELAAGQVRGVDAHGRLLVGDEDARAISAGEVTLREGACS